VTLDHISATMTYVMNREEHLWNVSTLQRVHLSNLVDGFNYISSLQIALVK
jgi:hypothetical protein